MSGNTTTIYPESSYGIHSYRFSVLLKSGCCVSKYLLHLSLNSKSHGICPFGLCSKNTYKQVNKHIPLYMHEQHESLYKVPRSMDGLSPQRGPYISEIFGLGSPNISKYMDGGGGGGRGGNRGSKFVVTSATQDWILICTCAVEFHAYS